MEFIVLFWSLISDYCLHIFDYHMWLWLILELHESSQSKQADFYRRRPQQLKDQYITPSATSATSNHHNGIQQAHNHARGSQPTIRFPHRLHTYAITVPRPKLSLHTAFDRSARIRYTLWSPTSGIPAPKAREMGSEQGINTG